jgi:AcrR family transcriptional regulator
MGQMDHVSLREQNRQRVSQRIISVAESLFKAHGFDRTTMDDIAEKAEISRATLFNYFPSKEALLLPWGREILEQQIQPQLTAYLSTQPATVQVLQLLFSQMSESLRAFPDVVRAFVREASKSFDPAYTGVADLGVQEVLIQVLRYGQERGEVRTDIPLEHIACYLSALQTSLLFRLLEKDAPGDAQQEIGRLLAFIEGGLSPKSTTLHQGDPST